MSKFLTRVLTPAAARVCVSVVLSIALGGR